MYGASSLPKSVTGYSQGLVIALVASLLVLSPSYLLPAQANGATFANEDTCGLTFSAYEGQS